MTHLYVRTKCFLCSQYVCDLNYREQHRTLDSIKLNLEIDGNEVYGTVSSAPLITFRTELLFSRMYFYIFLYTCLAVNL